MWFPSSDLTILFQSLYTILVSVLPGAISCYNSFLALFDSISSPMFPFHPIHSSPGSTEALLFDSWFNKIQSWRCPTRWFAKNQSKICSVTDNGSCIMCQSRIRQSDKFFFTPSSISFFHLLHSTTPSQFFPSPQNIHLVLASFYREGALGGQG